MKAVSRSRRTLGRIAVGAVLGLVLGGCSVISRSPFEVMLPGFRNLQPLPVRVIDHSNTIRAVEVPPALPDGWAAPDPHTIAVPGRPNAVYLFWVGGACDERVDIAFTERDRTFTLSTLRGQVACEAIGIGRSIIVAFSSPVDAASFTIHEVR